MGVGHHHLRSRSTRLKQGPFPPMRLCCPHHHQYYEPLRLLIRLLSGFRSFSLYQSLRRLCPVDRMRPLLFHRLLSQHPAPHTPEGSSTLLLRVFTPSLAFAFTLQARLPLVPISGSTFRRCRAKLCLAIHFMLRAVDLLSFLRRLHRFSTTSHPTALDACYLAA